jgi:hypothetical protein
VRGLGDDAPGGRRQHLCEDVKEEGEQEREGNLGLATWAAGMRRKRSQVGFIWAQGLGYRGKAVCRRSRLERGFDLRIFIERNVLAWHDRYAKEKGTIVQHLDSIEPGWRGCGVEDLASRGPMRGRGIR